MLEFAVRIAQGGRSHMEDFARVEHPFGGRADALYAAVFDGHGGDRVARRASERFHVVLAAELGRKAQDLALREAFRAFGREVGDETSGAVAVVALLEGRALAVANVGDSHALLVSRVGHTLLTTDHRITNEEEARRVLAAGAKIRDPYVFVPGGGGLMITRAFGDREFRGVGIIPEPAVASRALAAEDEWLVLGSDGVWDPLEVSTVAGIARTSPSAKIAVERVLQAALEPGSDNVGVVVLRLP